MGNNVLLYSIVQYSPVVRRVQRQSVCDSVHILTYRMCRICFKFSYGFIFDLASCILLFCPQFLAGG